MAELSNIDKIRKKRRRKIFLVRFLVLLALSFAGIFLYAIKDELAGIGLLDWARDSLATVGRGAGYPLDFSGEQGKGTYHCGKNLVVLTDTNLFVYNKSGKEIRNIQHKYSNPVVRIGGGRILIYDRGGKKLRVETLSRTVAQKEYPFAIYAADISCKGEVAVATGAQRYLAELSVYDHQFSEPKKFSFLSAENYITNVCFTKDGRSVSVGAVNAKEGNLLSSVQLFRLSEQAQTGVREFPGELLHSLYPVRDGVCVLTDASATILSKDAAVVNEYPYHFRCLQSYDHNENGDTALLFGSPREEKTGELVLLSPSGEVLWQKTVSSHVQQLTISNTRVVFALDGKLFSYDRAGKHVLTQVLQAENLELEAVESNAYLITPEQIQEFSLN